MSEKCICLFTYSLKCLFKSVGFPHPAISARVQVIIIFVYAVVIVS